MGERGEASIYPDLCLRDGITMASRGRNGINASLHVALPALCAEHISEVLLPRDKSGLAGWLISGPTAAHFIMPPQKPVSIMISIIRIGLPSTQIGLIIFDLYISIYLSLFPHPLARTQAINHKQSENRSHGAESVVKS